MKYSIRLTTFEGYCQVCPTVAFVVKWCIKLHAAVLIATVVSFQLFAPASVSHLARIGVAT